MFSLFRHHRWLFCATLIAAVALRLYFIHPPKAVTTDSGDAYVYVTTAKNLLHTGTYSLTVGHATMMRMPGYALYLVGFFKVFGENNFAAPLYAQALLDLLACFLLAMTAAKIAGERAGRWAFVLAAICPFTANYVGVLLTETLELFCTSLTLWLAVLACEALEQSRLRRALWLWAAAGASLGYAILLRPDGGVLLAALSLALCWQLWRRRQQWRRWAISLILFGAVSLAPLAPWTARNWAQFHVFQPLINPYACDPGEYVILGWDHWVYTWALDYSVTEDLLFHVSGAPIDMKTIPDRAFSDDAERDTVEKLVEAYEDNGCDMSPALDRQFMALYEKRAREHPFTVKVLYPTIRVFDMWMRPRTEMLALDTHFWDYENDLHDSLWACAYGLLNFFYVAGALIVAVWARGRLKWLSLLILYPILRSILLWRLLAIEDRYTLECYPMVILLCACLCVVVGRRKAADKDDSLTASAL